MRSYANNFLNDERLERLLFAKHEDYYADIDFEVLIYELINGSGYQQFVFKDDEEEEKISFGVPLKTVQDLIKQYHPITVQLEDIGLVVYR